MMTDHRDCPHRPPCPGCPSFGDRQLDPEGLGRLNRLAESQGLEPVTVATGSPWGYRHRARLAVRGRARSPKIGIFQRGSHRIADIPSCQIHHPLINRSAAALKRAIRATGIEPYVEGPHRGVLRYVQSVVETASQTVWLTLVGNTESEEPLLPLVEHLGRELGDTLGGVWWNGQRERGNVILGDEWCHLAGRELTRESFGGATVFYHPGAFGQANPALAARMIERIHTWVPDDAAVVEFHSGSGAIGLGLLPRINRMVFNEVSPFAIAGLETGLGALPEDQTRRVGIARGLAADHVSLLDDADIVIIDPPRKGIEPALLERLVERPPARLIAISCGLDSFLRNAKRLLEQSDLRLTALEAWGLFPFTPHIETLARFDRA